MAKISGKDFADYYVSGMKQSLEKIRKGVDAVTEAPGRKAAARRDAWVAKLTSREVQEKWATNVAAVSLEEWKRKMQDTGIGRIPGGVDAAAEKMAKFGEQLITYQEANIGKIKAMPKLTLSDSKARMDAWFDTMSKFRFRR